MNALRFKMSALCALSFCLAGCASMEIQSFTVHANRSQDAVAFFRTIDNAVAKAGVSDASVLRVKGFPYLRADRFLIGLKAQLSGSDKLGAWVDRMAELCIVSRTKEIRNLREEDLHELNFLNEGLSTREELIDKMGHYVRQLREYDELEENYHETLLTAVRDPGGYSIVMRTLGAYPLFAVPIAIGTVKAYDEFKAIFNAPLENLNVVGMLTTYAPQQALPYDAQSVLAIISQKKDLLGIPQLSPEDTETLARIFAPVLNIDVYDANDRIGTIGWRNGKVTVNTEKPSVYYYVSHALHKGKPIVQMNYAFWYPGRLGPYAPWLERGPLDGMTVRVSLDERGEPFMTDIMNSCGCYYFFAPRMEAVERIIPTPFGLDPFVPTWMPKEFPAQRMALRIDAGWHQVQSIDASGDINGADHYELLPYEILESLEGEDGMRASVFNRHGIMKDSSRIEPLVFFPSGIHDIGYMRQRGNHPIKLVGYAHFTDATLFKKNFEFK